MEAKNLLDAKLNTLDQRREASLKLLEEFVLTHQDLLIEKPLLYREGFLVIGKFDLTNTDVAFEREGHKCQLAMSVYPFLSSLRFSRSDDLSDLPPRGAVFLSLLHHPRGLLHRLQQGRGPTHCALQQAVLSHTATGRLA